MASTEEDMNKFFHWVPLAPRSQYYFTTTLKRLANAGALLIAILAAFMVSLNLGSSVWGLIPLILSTILFGLPHGAVDHLVLLGLARRRLTLPSLFLVCGAYLAGVLLVLLLWWLLPLFALIFFLVYTIFHWGKADLAFEAICGHHNNRVRLNARAWAHLLLRGLLPIGIPFISFPQQTRDFLNQCLDTFGYEFIHNSSLSFALILVIGLLVVLEIGYCFQGKVRWMIALETLGLLIFFLTVPPLLAIGLYFCGWHGLRHVLRLLNYSEAEQGEQTTKQLGKALLRFFLRATPFTILSLLMLWALQGLAAPTSNFYGVVAIYLILISALTLPHILVVEWMDRTEFS